MKNIILLILLLALNACKPSENYAVFDLDSLNITGPIVGEVDSAKEALQAARGLGFEKKIPFEELRIHPGYQRWKIIVRRIFPGYHLDLYLIQLRNGVISYETFKQRVFDDFFRDSYWEVTYISRDFIPPYSCTINITNLGLEHPRKEKCGSIK